jgi:ABC-type bacteriocin/lantibiotic exporter with double-glycine peptidase domain
VVIKDATFSLDDKKILQNISLKIKRGQFIAIVGKVGSGKSSLLSAILGDLRNTCGSIDVCGNISYVPQTPWLFNSTLRENILFGSSFDQDRFQRVLECCALDKEVAALPLKDLTEVGEKVE